MTAKPLAGRRILVAEDEALQAMYLRQTLEDAGATVVAVGYTLKQALAQRDAELDAAVLDVNLDGEAVFPIAEALAARAIPLVFHTAYVLKMDFAPLGRVRVCQKPSVPAEVVDALCDVLDIVRPGAEVAASA